MGLDVAVDDAGGVDGVQAVEDLAREAHGVRGRERRFLVDGGLQRPPRDVLEGEVVGAAVLAVVVHVDDVGVVDRGRRPGLAQEAGQEGRFGGELAAQHLQGHRPAEDRVAGPVGGREGPLADAGLHGVAAEGIGRPDRDRCGHGGSACGAPCAGRAGRRVDAPGGRVAVLRPPVSCTIRATGCGRIRGGRAERG